eukprot:15468541-Alexandrium_andersonii.AAC.1
MTLMPRARVAAMVAHRFINGNDPAWQLAIRQGGFLALLPHADASVRATLHIAPLIPRVLKHRLQEAS